MIRMSTLHAIERVLLAALLLAVATEAIAQTDVAGSRDHPLFNQMGGCCIEECQATDFNNNANDDGRGKR